MKKSRLLFRDTIRSFYFNVRPVVLIHYCIGLVVNYDLFSVSASITVHGLTPPENGRAEMTVSPANEAEAVAKTLHNGQVGESNISCRKVSDLYGIPIFKSSVLN